VLKLLLTLLGWTIAHTPEALLRGFAAALGDAVFFLLPRRRRIVLSNLSHAFPDRPRAWRHRVGRASCRRLVETGLFSLATPFLGEARLRTILRLSPDLPAVFAAHGEHPRATLFCSPHIAYWEAQTAQALLLPAPLPEFGIIYRPLDNPAADALVKRSRERFGMRLLSRKAGFQEALKILRRQGFVGVLFDQNAGLQGALTTLFGRVCSTTELPGLMAEKFSGRVYGVYPRRLGFWRVELNAVPVPTDGTCAGTTIALNRWLEGLLTRDENVCASWLWSHDRWRNQDIPARRLRLEAKRNLLAADGAARGWSALPRRTRLWVRLPNWLGDVVMTLPLLRALRASRPDAEITLIGKAAFAPLVQTWGVADRYEPLPPHGLGYFHHFWRQRRAYPDVYLLFTNSLRGDLEAWLTRCPQRFGLLRPGKLRPLLSHAYCVPADFDEQQHHQLELWENFLRHFGLAAPPDFTPLLSEIRDSKSKIGLIAGSENTPAKRWPVTHWRTLIEAFPPQHFVLLGTAKDAAITHEVAAGFAPERVTDLAGQTDLPGFAARLGDCALLVTNDTGGMHLANALGVPLIALFGPTNSVRTGPVFHAPRHLLQPPVGTVLADLPPATVIAAVQDTLHASPL
jgi:ADP-heptose:LPS heptosyltransferase/lauroyl/myristoyl acyltransferase